METHRFNHRAMNDWLDEMLKAQRPVTEFKFPDAWFPNEQLTLFDPEEYYDPR